MSKLKVVIKTDKETNESTLLAQTTSDETVERVKQTFNDNSRYGKNKFGDILGDKSKIEVFEKDDLRIAFEDNEISGGTGSDMNATSI